MNLTDAAGRSVHLGSRLGRGGEAEVFPVNTDPTVVAKIYHSPSAERAAKLQVMLANPPSDPTAGQGHVSICWPTGLLFDHRKVSVGFLMHRVDFFSNVPVFSLYNPQDRRQVAPTFTWEYLLRAAKNIASIVEAVHTRGYVVGDLNESNILVANTAMVTLVDCDSMQVPQPGTGMFFRCPVGKPEYTPPELQGCDFGRVDRIEAHDSFALAVLIFQLLMEGTHPFSGVWQPTGDPPAIEQRIRIGASPYTGISSARPMPGAPSFGILPPTLQALFQRCFRDGHHASGSRPTPREWQAALASAEAHLSACRSSKLHIYSAHLASCPWCERTRLLGGLDPFSVNSQQTPLKPAHFAAPVPVRATVPQSPVLAPPPARPSSRPPNPHLKPNLGRRIVIGALVVASIVLIAVFASRDQKQADPNGQSQNAQTSAVASGPADTTSPAYLQFLLPAEAKIVEWTDLVAVAQKPRIMVLWMLKPERSVRDATSPTCADWVHGDHWSGPTRLSLVDTENRHLVNSIKIAGENSGDTFNVPFLVGNSYYYVPNPNAQHEGKPEIMHARMFTDSTALTFPLFDYEACGIASTSAFGYSKQSDQVLQFPVLEASDLEPPVVKFWVEQIFGQTPVAPGHWTFTWEPGHGSENTIQEDVFFDTAQQRFVNHKKVTNSHAAPPPLAPPSESVPSPRESHFGDSAAGSTGATSPNQEVQRVVDQWVATTKSGDVSGHLSLYDDPVSVFYTKRNLGKTDLTNEIESIYKTYSNFTAVNLSSMSWHTVSPGLVQVQFDKEFNATNRKGGSYLGSVHSQLTLRQTSIGWRIVGETDTKIYWTKRMQ